jgi:xanthine dehydrogenase large subunit
MNPEILSHIRGESLYVDDLPEPAGTLFSTVLVSKVAHGRLTRLDTETARALPGVRCIFTAADIPGENQLGVIVQDEELLSTGAIDFVGQPLALVVADSIAQAENAAEQIVVEVEEREPLFDPRRAALMGELIIPSRTLSSGDPDEAFSRCSTIARGRVDSGGQEHVYLETQAALAIPLEGRRVRIHAGTQSPTGVQRIVAALLDLPMTSVEVEVKRLGGAFGGKEDQATPWAALAALGALALQRPVKLVLSREDDFRWTGKRHPYSSDFRLGLDEEGKILAYEVTFFQNAGAAADLSPAILERSLFHATGAYRIPAARITAHSCRTNLPPFTAFRGFGAPQATFVIESALAAAADASGIEREELQRRNLLAEDDTLPFGMRVSGCRARRCVDEATRRFDLASKREKIDAFNETHPLEKRGLSLMPICFGVSFTNKALNQAGALVHIFTDGTVQVSTGAVEMGQGVAAKIARIAATTLGVDRRRVRVTTTSTSTVANTSPTAASTGADLNGAAAELACTAIVERLLILAAALLEAPAQELCIEGELVHRRGEATELAWEELIPLAWQERINLSAQAHYATPRLDYDREAESGSPFSYHVWGAALTEVTVDCLRGTYRIDAVRIVHDAGRSLDPLVDRGQVEGALLQGLGWIALEELIHDERGRLLTESLATYKTPDIDFAPGEVEVVFLEDADNPATVLRSKGIGEPPLLYGIGAYFALRDAARAFGESTKWRFEAPMTAERMLLWLCGEGRDPR